jgi:hypothetical protein
VAGSGISTCRRRIASNIEAGTPILARATDSSARSTTIDAWLISVEVAAKSSATAK